MATNLELFREAEWRLCERDPLYWMEKYHHIPIIGKGYELFAMRDYQKGWIEEIHEDEHARLVRLKARQIGATTTYSAYALWSCIFRPERPWLILAQSELDASDTLSTKIRQPYSQLPKWMRDRGPTVDRDSQTEIAFDNGSRITALPSNSAAGRGRAVYGVLMDEVAFMESPDELFAAVDPMCYGPLVAFSTANGMGNFFHELWVTAQAQDSIWEADFQPWTVVEGRDGDWYKRQKSKYYGREHLLAQEFPQNPEEAFMKSGQTALNVTALRERQVFTPPEHRYDLALLDPEAADWGKMMDSVEIPDDEQRPLELHVWQLPYLERDDDGALIRQPNFVVGVDVSEGLEHGDYSAVSVWDVHANEQVATVKAHIPVEDVGAVAEFLGYWYFTALLAVERNNMGLVPLHYLQQARYPRIFRMDSIAQIKRGDRTPRYGFHTNKATKPKMIVDFNKALRDDTVRLNDERFLQEAMTFLSDGKGGYNASGTNHDDLIMGTLISYAAALDVGEYPTIWRDPDPGPLTFGEVMALGMPDAVEGYGQALSGGIGQAKQEATVRKSFHMLQRKP